MSSNELILQRAIFLQDRAGPEKRRLIKPCVNCPDCYIVF